MIPGERLSRREFRRGPTDLARRLLGCTLVRVLDDSARLSGTIVETEAYLGVIDRAAHTFGGRRTPRNESMYRDGGTAYVYFTYGMHHCFNVVCGAVDEPVAVLIRSLAPREGLQQMVERRSRPGREVGEFDLCSGPAKLTSALAIDRGLDREDMVESQRLWIERADRVVPRMIGAGPRIGVDYAGAWASRPLRFWIKENPHVSR